MTIEEIKKRVEDMVSRDENGEENVDHWDTWKDILQLELMIKIVDRLDGIERELRYKGL